MIHYFKNLWLHLKIAGFLVVSGLFLIVKALVPILPATKHFDLHVVINKVAFFYMDSYSQKK